jgi:hypothetical protein
MRFEGKWLPENDSFRQVCLELSKDLCGFKRNPVFVEYIGNDVRKIDVAREFYDYIKDRYMYLLQYDFRINDVIGEPNIFLFDNKEFSPGTLRFVKVVGDIYEHFGYVKNIVEIGSGYGGQALVFNVVQSLNYTCIDITECLELAKSYHHTLGWKSCHYMNSKNIKEKNYDLCISDYCLGEMNEEGIRFYVDNVVSKCKFAYITANRDGKYFAKMCSMLIDTFETVDCVEECPKTTRHNNCIIYCKK